MKIEQIAKVAHEINKSYCEAIGDLTQPTWDEAPEWQKESAINGVKFHLDNPNTTPEDSHKSWLAQKRKEGWSWGKVKDPEKKVHPCMIPYSDLPVDQKVKDYLFKQVIESLRDIV